MNNDISEIQKNLVLYILDKSDLTDIEEIPLDSSLLLNGVLDSFGVIELVEFIESNWKISIDDSEFTLEQMGSINKMTELISRKLAQ